MKKIRVLHIVGGDISGGAAKGALILHKELIKLGIDSFILKQVGHNASDDSIYSLSQGIISRFKRIIYTFLDRFPLLLYMNRRKDVAFSFGLFGFDITTSKYYKNADIINLHWINQGTFPLRLLRKIEKPIVWTIRDMWAMTGGCHHSFDCHRYEQSCGRCPLLASSKAYDLSSLIFDYKKAILSNKIRYVTISNWLKLVASRSNLLRDQRIDVIHNGISLDDFQVIDKTQARIDLGLPIDQKIVLLGATNLHDPYKGFSYFLQCLPKLLSDPDIHFTFFGQFNAKLYSKLFENRFLSFGAVQETALLNTIYSAADVFVAPSIAEAFGKTLAESMLSGTPVVCFDSTGPAEIVHHKITGYKARHKDPEDLLLGIQWCFENRSRLADLSKNARMVAESRFNGRKIALEYKALYEEMLKN